MSIELRLLTEVDIPALSQIRPTFRSPTVLHLERSVAPDSEHNDLGLNVGWQLREQPINPPYDRGTGYDFDSQAQAEIRARLAQIDSGCQRVAEDVQAQRIVGLLDAEIEAWNNTVFVWRLMIDQDYRRQGIGRRLWARAVDFARRSDVRALLVETQNTNVPACRFYAEMGCILCGLHEAFYHNPVHNPAYDDQNRNGTEFALFWTYPIKSKSAVGPGQNQPSSQLQESESKSR